MKLTVTHDSSGKTTAIVASSWPPKASSQFPGLDSALQNSPKWMLIFKGGNAYPARKNIPEAANAADINAFVS
jgi:hypothetical protein